MSGVIQEEMFKMEVKLNLRKKRLYTDLGVSFLRWLKKSEKSEKNKGEPNKELGELPKSEVQPEEKNKKNMR